jgi:hypothetical protein
MIKKNMKMEAIDKPKDDETTPIGKLFMKGRRY